MVEPLDHLITRMHTSIMSHRRDGERDIMKRYVYLEMTVDDKTDDEMTRRWGSKNVSSQICMKPTLVVIKLTIIFNINFINDEYPIGKRD